MGHPDFRVKGKIFATLGPDETWGMVKLTPREQVGYVHDGPPKRNKKWNLPDIVAGEA